MARVVLAVLVVGGLAADLAVPPSLDCSDQPRWESFRRQAVAHAGRGWPLTDDVASRALRDAADALHSRWASLVCADPCLTSEDLKWGWVEELGGRTCPDSPQFDRYITVHYFDNRGLKYKPPERAIAGEDGFCFYGFITALVVLAQFEFPESVARAQRLLFLAFTLLGDYLVFDWLESSGWPVRFVDVNVHLLLVSNSWSPLRAEQVESISWHPGEAGAAALRSHQRWQGSSEATKPSADGALAEESAVTVWQICQHTTVAGEAKTMLERFRDAVGVHVRFLGNSIGGNVCRNYGLCADGDVTAELNRHLAIYKQGAPFAEAAAGFVAAFRSRVASSDVLMCTQPPSWCRFLLAFGDKPVWMYVGLPLMWDVNAEDRVPWLREVRAMALSPKHLIVGSSVFLAKELQWQIGVLPPVVRLLGLHTGASYMPVRSDSILVSRFGTNAALSECVFSRFRDANPWYPLRFVQLEAVLFEEHQRRDAGDAEAALSGAASWERHRAELKTPGMPYATFAEHRAAILFPYDAVIFLFHELYSMQVPVFVPRDLWRWLFGPLTFPPMQEQLEADEMANGTWTSPRPLHSPFFAAPRRPIDIEQATSWAPLTDWALLPHVQYFRSAAELMQRALDFEALRAVSSRMKDFNEDQLVSVVASWRSVALRLAYVATTARKER